MVQESFDYIFNLEHRPNKTAVLLAIPMYMYRIETSKIEYGINFFQKAVLMFKTKPGIENNVIATCLGLDEKLVDLVTEQLITSRLITADGRLTEKGFEMKNDIDGLIVDESKKSIGYVFQHLNDDGLYAFYVNNIRKASVINGEICTGTKGDAGEEDYYTMPILAEKLLENRVINYAPSEREILGIIRRSNKHSFSNKEVEVLDIDAKKYGITFVPDNHPTIVWVCTYAYVPRIKDEVYGSEWEIQDPFGFENNSELKLYVESLLDAGLIDDFRTEFGNLTTVNDQTIDQFHVKIDEMVLKEMEASFDIGYCKLDTNLLKYIWTVLKNYLLLGRAQEVDYSDSFVINIQKALETIFKIDCERNEAIYNKVFIETNYETRRRDGSRTDLYSKESRSDFIDELFFYEGLRAEYKIEEKIRKFTADFNIKSVRSLKSYLIRFLFSYKYRTDHTLYDIIKEKVGVIWAIADHRNSGGHGSTSTEGHVQGLCKDDIELYFNEFKQIINNYIIRYNG